jgi:hypothetical protein
VVLLQESSRKLLLLGLFCAQHYLSFDTNANNRLRLNYYKSNAAKGKHQLDLSDSTSLQVVEQTIRPCLLELQEDADVDVRFFAGQALQACDQVMCA